MIVLLPPEVLLDRCFFNTGECFIPPFWCCSGGPARSPLPTCKQSLCDLATSTKNTVFDHSPQVAEDKVFEAMA